MTPAERAQVQAAIDQIKVEAMEVATREMTKNISTYLRWAGLSGYVLDLHFEVNAKVEFKWRRAVRFTGMG